MTSHSKPARLRALLTLALATLCCATIEAKPAPPAVPQGFYTPAGWTIVYNGTSDVSQDATAVAGDQKDGVPRGLLFAG
jgi:hypothetical protein